MILTFSYSGGTGHVITVQWYLNGVALVDGVYGDTSVSGATTTTLTIDNPTTAYNGFYYAIVTDETADCSLQTDSVEITNCALAISEQPAISICYILITEQPETPVTVEVDDELSLTFAYTSLGAGPVTVQWFKDDVALVDGPTGSGSTISGATTTTLSITDAQLTDNGNYHAVVTDGATDACTQATETSAVTVVEGSALPLPTAFWKLDEIEEPIVGGEGAAGDRAEQVQGLTLFLSGDMPGYEDARGGSAASAFFTGSGFRQLHTNEQAGLAYTSPNNISVSYWIQAKEPLEEPADFSLYFGASGANGGLTFSPNYPDLDIFIDNGVDFDVITIPNLTMTVGQWYMWTLVYAAGTGLMSFYIDTTLIGTTSTPVSFATSTVGEVFFGQPGFSAQMLVSQLSVWLNYALTTDDIDVLFNTGTGITCCPFA